MSNIKELLNKLAKLKLEEKNLRKCLDIKYYDDEKRAEIFNKIKDCKKEIEKIKFKIKMEEKLNAKDNNTNESNN